MLTNIVLILHNIKAVSPNLKLRVLDKLLGNNSI